MQFLIGISYDTPSVFASEEWCTVPFEQLGKRPVDTLADILLQIPEAHLLRNKMRDLRKHVDESSDAFSESVKDKALHIISQLGTYGLEHQDVINSSYDYSRFHEITNFQSDARSWIVEDASPACFRDPFAAVTIALYDGGLVLANALAWEATPRNSKYYKERIVIHCESILSAVAYFESRGPSSGGTLLMIFPLKAACRTSPSDDQRRRVRAALAMWGTRRGVDGICKFQAHETEGIFLKICEAEESRKERDSSTLVDDQNADHSTITACR